MNWEARDLNSALIAVALTPLVISAALGILLGLVALIGALGRRIAPRFAPMRNRPFMAAYFAGAPLAFGVTRLALLAPLLLGFQDIVVIFLLIWLGFIVVAGLASAVLRMALVPIWLSIAALAALTVMQSLNWTLGGGPIKVDRWGEEICAQMGGVEMTCPQAGPTLMLGLVVAIASFLFAAFGLWVSMRRRADFTG